MALLIISIVQIENTGCIIALYKRKHHLLIDSSISDTTLSHDCSKTSLPHTEYIVVCQYDSTPGDFLLSSKYESSFDTTAGILGYFDPQESYEYTISFVQKVNSFSGYVKHTTLNEVEARFSIIEHLYASNGDGISAGSMNVNVNYTGSYAVSESNPKRCEQFIARCARLHQFPPGNPAHLCSAHNCFCVSREIYDVGFLRRIPRNEIVQ